MTQRPQDGHHFDLLLLPRDADGCRGIETSREPSTIGLGWANLWCTGCIRNGPVHLDRGNRPVLEGEQRSPPNIRDTGGISLSNHARISIMIACLDLRRERNDRSHPYLRINNMILNA